MGWTFTRILAALLMLGLGALLGRVTGDAVGAPSALTGVGAVLGVCAAVLFDARRGHRVMVWLRGPQAGSAPRDSGFWGELAYRIERAMRIRTGETDGEAL